MATRKEVLRDAMKHPEKKGKLFGKPRSEVVKHPGSFRAAADKRGMSTTELYQKILAHPENYSSSMVAKAKEAKAFHTMREEKKK